MCQMSISGLKVFLLARFIVRLSQNLISVIVCLLLLVLIIGVTVYMFVCYMRTVVLLSFALSIITAVK